MSQSGDRNKLIHDLIFRSGVACVAGLSLYYIFSSAKEKSAVGCSANMLALPTPALVEHNAPSLVEHNNHSLVEHNNHSPHEILTNSDDWIEISKEN